MKRLVNRNSYCFVTNRLVFSELGSAPLLSLLLLKSACKSCSPYFDARMQPHLHFRAVQQQQPAFRFVGKFSVPDYSRKFAGEGVEDILDSLQLRVETALMQRILFAVFFFLGMGTICLNMFKGKEIHTI